MKRTSTNNYKAAVYAYLIDCMNDDGAQGMTPAQKVAWIAERVRSEMPHVLKSRSLAAACIEWLQGLGMAIDYTYTDILEAAGRLHGEDPAVWTNRQTATIQDQWFAHMGYKLAELIAYVEAGKVALLPVAVPA